MSPLRLTRVCARNYKAFESPIQLELAPLTLVFGRNGSGKSALVRLPAALAGALTGSGPPGLPLQMSDGLTLGQSLASFVHGGGAGEYGVGVVLSTGEGLGLHLDVEVRRDPKTSLRSPGQWISFWSLSSDGVELGKFTWRDRRYDAQDSTEADRPMTFAGLLPVLRDGSLHPLTARLRPAPRVLHLSAARDAPGEDFTAYQPSIPLEVGHLGVLTRQVVGALLFHPRKEILQSVITSVAECFDVELRVVEVGEGALLGTVIEGRRTGRNNWLPLRELGTGLMHALPLIVQCALAAHPGEDNPPLSLVTCEEPEAHSHPRTQAQIADVVIHAALAGGASTLIETHSETFVLRVRRRVAEGVLRPEQVALYWVDDEAAVAQVRRLHLDQQGYVEDWPEGWFDTALHEVSAIRQALGKYER